MQSRYAPTGTNGVLGANSEFRDFKTEPKILDFVKRGGSTSVTFGAQLEQVDEHPTGGCAAFTVA